MGSSFTKAFFRKLRIEESSFAYANLTGTSWENCSISESNFREVGFAEAKLKKLMIEDVDFTKADFFKTSLNGLNMASCRIEGITISDSFSELKGLRISALQAVELARLLGITVI